MRLIEPRALKEGMSIAFSTWHYTRPVQGRVLAIEPWASHPVKVQSPVFGIARFKQSEFLSLEAA